MPVQLGTASNPYYYNNSGTKVYGRVPQSAGFAAPAQQAQRSASTTNRGLGSAEQAGRDIYGATYGAAQRTMQDPLLAELSNNLMASARGEGLPYNQQAINSLQTSASDASAAAAANQASAYRQQMAARGVMPGDAAYNTRLNEINANRLTQNQQANNQINQAAVSANYSAQQSAIDRAIAERLQQMGMSNQLDLAGAGYSSQVQTPVQYQDPNAGIYDLIQQMYSAQQAEPAVQLQTTPVDMSYTTQAASPTVAPAASTTPPRQTYSGSYSTSPAAQSTTAPYVVGSITMPDGRYIIMSDGSRVKE